jgi:hypothetical protein
MSDSAVETRRAHRNIQPDSIARVVIRAEPHSRQQTRAAVVAGTTIRVIVGGAWKPAHLVDTMGAWIRDGNFCVALH